MNPDSLALGLVFLAYSIGLVQAVRYGQATCYVWGPQTSGTDMPNSLLSIVTYFPVSLPTGTVTLSTGKSTLYQRLSRKRVLGPHSHATTAVYNLPVYGPGSESARAFCDACTDGVGGPAKFTQEAG